MNDMPLKEMVTRKKWTLAAWGLLIFAPWLQLAILSLVIGQNAFTAYPVWTDELDYWRNLFSWLHVGLPLGYNGLGEYPPMIGTLSVHGLTPLILYGGWVKLFGLTHYSIVMYNALWVSLGALTFCLLVKPKATTTLWIMGFFMIFVPVLLYATTSMTESFNYAMFLFYAAFLFHSEKTKCKWTRVLCWAVVIWACLYRITYFVLFLPLLIPANSDRLSLKMLWKALLAVVLSVAAYGISTAVTAPYPSGFLYHWVRAESFGIFTQMFLSHAKGNVLDYFVRATNSPMEDALRILYCAAMLWTFVASFLRLTKEEGAVRVKFGVRREWALSFLLLFIPFALVLMIYETNDWSDFRTLAPFLWGVTVLLFLWGKRKFALLMLAASVAVFGWFCTLEPIGAFRDENRFEAPYASEAVVAACADIVPIPGAEDPYVNTIRCDIPTFQVMSSVDPSMGLMFGWFLTENVNESHWILTDHLKIIVTGYEPIANRPGANIYRRIDYPKP